MSHPINPNADADAAAAATSSPSPRPALAIATAAAQLDTAAVTKAKSPEEPLSLEYATPNAVPLHMHHLLSQSNHHKVSSAELLFLLVYLVALESGFVEEKVFEQKRHLLKSVPPVGCFHIYNVRLLSQQPVHFSREFGDTAFRLLLRTLLRVDGHNELSVVATLQTRLMAVMLGDLLMVTLSPVPPSNEPGCSVCLSIGRYVLNVQLEPLYKRFHKLDELSLLLRQKLFQPMRAQQMLALKLHNHPSLLGLPSELYDEIFRHLNNNQLNILANVNWQLCNCSKQFKDRRQHDSGL